MLAGAFLVLSMTTIPMDVSVREPEVDGITSGMRLFIQESLVRALAREGLRSCAWHEGAPGDAPPPQAAPLVDDCTQGSPAPLQLTSRLRQQEMGFEGELVLEDAERADERWEIPFSAPDISALLKVLEVDVRKLAPLAATRLGRTILARRLTLRAWAPVPIAAGAVAAGVGGVLLGIAAQNLQQLSTYRTTAPVLEPHEAVRLARDGSRNRLVGAVLVGLGVVGLGAGGVLLASPERAAPLALSPDIEHGGLVLMGGMP